MAAITRTSTGMPSRPPTRSMLRSCKKRRSFTCRGGVSSPISSRKSVPPLAYSILPFLRASAPVKAPFSWPKSSLSSRFSGMAPQLMATKGPPFRLLEWCMARATSSFPVPLSPTTSTDVSVVATFLMTP